MRAIEYLLYLLTCIFLIRKISLYFYLLNNPSVCKLSSQLHFSKNKLPDLLIYFIFYSFKRQENISPLVF